jgi:SpoIID/LytB domain protein
MSQYGAQGYALHGWGYERILAHYYRGTHLSRITNRIVRVRVVAARRQVAISSRHAYRIRDAAGRAWTLHPRRLVLKSDGRVRIRGRHVRLRPPIAVEPGASVLAANGRAYRGTLRVLRTGRRLTVVNHVPLDLYVRGVVPWEMPHGWEPNALAAQAIASRSYAVSQLGSRATFDVHDDTRDQVYGGVVAETRTTNRAVARTARLIVTWNGAVARTYYSSTSGGRTSSLPGVPYLRSVPDPYDRISPHHRWGPIRYTGRRLGRLLNTPPPTGMHVARKPDGRARAVYVRWRKGGSWVSGDDFRSRLGLRSTWFAVTPLGSTRRAAGARARGSGRTPRS